MSDIRAKETPPADRLRTMRRSFDSTARRSGTKRSAISRTAPTIAMTAAVMANGGTERNCSVRSAQLRHMAQLSSQMAHFGAPLPAVIDRGIDQQLHQERREEAADHRRGNPLHHV